jgi:hypothetical protein
MEVQYHKEAAAGRWFEFSLLEQMANIGSEVGRAARGDKKAVDRALELFDLTLSDPRWIQQKRLREIARARELFCSAAQGEDIYHTSLQDLELYFYSFMIAARNYA